MGLLKLKLLAAFGAATLSLSAVSAGAEETTKMVFEVEGDVAAGEKIFKKCKACHAVGEGAENKVGPQLNGVLGRAAASIEDFKYSKALIEKAAEEELVWTPETLNEFLLKPKDYVKGTKMAFAGIRKDTQRADVIAYLAGFE